MENPMRQSMRAPVMGTGIIPGKVHLDWGHVQQCMANADDANLAKDCYPGGGKDVHHDVMPGDFSFGEKCVRDHSNGFNELGMVAVNGIYTGNFMTHREMESNYYPQGVAVTECRVSNPMDNPMAQDPDHGYAIVKAGTVPTINNGPFTLYPNTFVMLRFPPSQLYGNLNRVSEDIQFGSGNHRARLGTFPGQLRPELVPFDYTDFNIHYDSAYHLMGITQSKGGISDIKFEDVRRNRKAYVDDSSKYSAEQEEALGHFYGTLNLILAYQQVAAEGGKVADWEKFDADDTKAFVRKVFLYAYQSSIQASGQPAINAATNAGKLRPLGATFHSGHVMGNYYDKCSKIVGKPLNASGPSETLDLMLGHFCL
jgi:hypothetical protein